VRDSTAEGAPELLFVRLRGAVAAVEAACERMLCDAPGERMDNTQAAPDWDDCREQRLPFFQRPDASLSLWRLSLPQTTPALLERWDPLVEWQGAQRWLWAPAEAAADIRAAAEHAGGHATLWFASGDGAPGVPRFQPPTAVVQTLNQRLRQEFDPAGIFNPGRMG
jgi:glycolate oxidase FAD binding subunit